MKPIKPIKPVLRIGFIGRMTEQKQPLLWVDVAAGVHALRPDVTFVMAGDGDLMSAVRRSVTWNR